jgi:peptidyl-tRNA hydrolase, PTH1 family
MQNVVAMMPMHLPPHLQKNNVSYAVVWFCFCHSNTNKYCRKDMFSLRHFFISVFTDYMETYDWLIVGLGNPGDKYARTRHNIGWIIADALRTRYATSETFTKGKGAWMQVAMRIGSSRVLMALPITYMNASGEAVERLRVVHRIPNDRILAIVDEYNFPTGKIHVRQGGSSGGHNGIGSMIECLRTDQFWRLRCGIDKKFPPGGMAEYVLGEFPADEAPAVELMIHKSQLALELICRKGALQAMSLINSAKFGEPPTSGVSVKTSPATPKE